MEQQASSPQSPGSLELWSGRDTTPDAIEAALRRLLHQRYASGRLVTSAGVLNLVVVAAGARAGEVAARLAGLGRYEPGSNRPGTDAAGPGVVPTVLWCEKST